MHDQFKIKSLGDFRYFLGLEVAWSQGGIHVCQRKYALDILANSGFLGVRPVKLPMDQNFKFSKDTGSPLSDTSLYRRLVEHLLYLTITRQDLCYSTQVLSQFMDSPTISHLHTVHKILLYVKRALGQGLTFPASSSLSL